METYNSQEAFHAASVLARLGNVISKPLGPNEYHIEVVDCRIYGGTGGQTRCCASGATAGEGMIKLLQTIRDLPEGGYVMNDKRVRLVLVNDMWSRYARSKGGE